MTARATARLNRWSIAGGAAVLCFGLLVLRFWHPVDGFTRFLQLDARNDATKIAELRGQPIYVYRNTGGYDGQYYAQIGYHPLLDAPELKVAVDNLNYRARRILPAALAWIVAAGRPSQIARVYAWLNLAAWLALAALAWRAIAVRGPKGFAAWLGILFSAGALTSVRFALTDLIAATLTVLAFSVSRPAPALACAALSRETALLALPGIWTRPWLSRKNLAAAAIAAGPLVGWLIYLRWRLGPGDAGFDNFTWPFQGWANKWVASLGAIGGPVDFSATFSTLLALVGLTVQAMYVALRRDWDDPWWRVGAAYGVLLAFLGQAVWEGFPGAAFRAVLPLTVAFNLLMARRSAGWAWLVAGNLGVVAGVVALWLVPVDPSELAAGAGHGRRAIVWEGTGWYGAERTTRHRWAWATGPKRPERSATQTFEPVELDSSSPLSNPIDGLRSVTLRAFRGSTITIEAWPKAQFPVHCMAEFRSLQPQHVSVRQDGRVLWSGDVGPVKTPAQWDVGVLNGNATLELAGDRPAVPESTAPSARTLAFAIYDLKVNFPDARSDPP